MLKKHGYSTSKSTKKLTRLPKGEANAPSYKTKLTVKAKLKEDELATVRNKEAYLAIAQLKQSRRCGQLAVRPEEYDQAEQDH